jgi:tRNA1Val (adenine37-N6)-methyltransferase
MSDSLFHFKKFSVSQRGAAHKVGTDGVLIGAWVQPFDASTILDIGTGTGLIALMLAQKAREDVRITAIDIQQEAVACAEGNFEQSPWSANLRAYQSSIQAFAQQATQKFDLIVSNPPFFSERVFSPNESRNTSRNTSSLSLEELAEGIVHLLKPGGRCCLIFPVKEGKSFVEICAIKGLYVNTEVEVLGRAGKPVERLLLELSHSPQKYQKQVLEIFEADAAVWTDGFKSLTGEYYLKI